MQSDFFQSDKFKDFALAWLNTIGAKVRLFESKNKDVLLAIKVPKEYACVPVWKVWGTLGNAHKFYAEAANITVLKVEAERNGLAILNLGNVFTVLQREHSYDQTRINP